MNEKVTVIVKKSEMKQTTLKWSLVRPDITKPISSLDCIESSTAGVEEVGTTRVPEVGNLGEGAAEVGASHPSEGSEASCPEVDTRIESSSPPAQMRVQGKVLAEKCEFLDEKFELLDERCEMRAFGREFDKKIQSFEMNCNTAL